MTIEEYAEMILQAAGTSLRHYTMCKWRDAILAAVRAVYKDGQAATVTADRATIAALPAPNAGPLQSLLEAELTWRASIAAKLEQQP